jgi:hypothetical protein
VTFEDLLSRFDAVRPTGSGHSARCPVHEDRVSSLSISRGEEGRALIYCHAGCSLDDLLLTLGLTLSDLFDDDPAPAPVPTPVLTSGSNAQAVTYAYHDLDGTLLHEVVKGAGKRFRQRHPTPEGWVWKASGRRVPYRWPELVGQSELWIVEGERDVDTLFDNGLTATCNLGGASKWRAEETAALLDLHPDTVYVIPDNDTPGRKHADSVLEQITAAGITATLVPLPGLAAHGDASDWFAAGGTAESLRALADDPPDPETVIAPTVEAVDILTADQVFSRLGEDAYSLDYPALGVTFLVSHLHRDRDDLKCELTVNTTLPHARTVDGTLLWTATNLSAARTRAGLAKGLASRSGEPKWDWLSALESLSVLVSRAEAEGSSEIKPLSDFDLPTDDPAWTIAGLPILKDHPTILFGDGGAAKSYLALYIAGTIASNTAGTKILFADWEFEPEAHRDRLQRLFGSGMPRERLHYVRCSQPLVNEVGRLQKHILEQNITYMILDSITFSLNGPPESAEVAAGFFRSLRMLNVGSLSLAHQTKGGDNSDKTVFGSAFYNNGARSVWHVRRNDDEGADSSTVELALSHRKSNTGQRLSTRGIKLDFAGTTTTVDTFDLAGSADLATTLPIWQRVKAIVSHTPMTIPQLASDLEANPQSIARIVRRMDLFRKDTSDRVCLVETTLRASAPDEARF